MIIIVISIIITRTYESHRAAAIARTCQSTASAGERCFVHFAAVKFPSKPYNLALQFRQVRAEGMAVGHGLADGAVGNRGGKVGEGLRPGKVLPAGPELEMQAGDAEVDVDARALVRGRVNAGRV